MSSSSTSFEIPAVFACRLAKKEREFQNLLMIKMVPSFNMITKHLYSNLTHNNLLFICSVKNFKNCLGKWLKCGKFVREGFHFLFTPCVVRFNGNIVSLLKFLGPQRHSLDHKSNSRGQKAKLNTYIAQLRRKVLL